MTQQRPQKTHVAEGAQDGLSTDLISTAELTLPKPQGTNDNPKGGVMWSGTRLPSLENRPASTFYTVFRVTW